MQQPEKRSFFSRPFAMLTQALSALLMQQAGQAGRTAERFKTSESVKMEIPILLS